MVPLLLSLFFDVNGLAPLLSPHGAIAAPLQVDMVLAAGAAMPGATASVTDEVERIWQGSAVSFHWIREDDARGEHADRVVLVDITETPAGGWRVPRTALGGVPMVAGRFRQVIYVSPSRVRQLVRSTGAHPLDAHFDAVYARMLGRVIAHELGHLLLASTGHHPTGLMRASFDKQDVAARTGPRFDLPRDDVAALHRRTLLTRLASLAPAARPTAVASGH